MDGFRRLSLVEWAEGFIVYLLEIRRYLAQCRSAILLLVSVYEYALNKDPHPVCCVHHISCNIPFD